MKITGMNAYSTCVLAVASMARPIPAQSTSQHGPYRMEIVLERRDAGAWHTVDPGLVLEQNDRVRFRFHTNFDGYLYVMNQSTSGTYALLFPSEETGRENRIHAGKEYLVPATQTLFRIAGPAGHEIVYWMLTPVELRTEAADKPYVPLPPARRMHRYLGRTEKRDLARAAARQSGAGPVRWLGRSDVHAQTDNGRG